MGGGGGGVDFSFDVSKIVAYYAFMETNKNVQSEDSMKAIEIVLSLLPLRRKIMIIID